MKKKILNFELNDSQTINHLIETGNSEQIFQKAMQEAGQGQVYIRGKVSCKPVLPFDFVCIFNSISSLVKKN